MPVPEGRLVAGFDVDRTRDRSELAVFEESERRGSGEIGVRVIG
ncbi:hypothetical protein [Corallococcus carmarthensis]|nr:hypothetical protein [Corallococcus carmarthensis]